MLGSFDRGVGRIKSSYARGQRVSDVVRLVVPLVCTENVVRIDLEEGFFGLAGVVGVDEFDLLAANAAGR